MPEEDGESAEGLNRYFILGLAALGFGYLGYRRLAGSPASADPAPLAGAVFERRPSEETLVPVPPPPDAAGMEKPGAGSMDFIVGKEDYRPPDVQAPALNPSPAAPARPDRPSPISAPPVASPAVPGTKAAGQKSASRPKPFNPPRLGIQKTAQLTDPRSAPPNAPIYYATPPAAIPAAADAPESAGRAEAPASAPPPSEGAPRPRVSARRAAGGGGRGQSPPSYGAQFRPQAQAGPAGAGGTSLSGQGGAAGSGIESGGGTSESGGMLVGRGRPDGYVEPNPERPLDPNGPCPTSGWWKNTATGWCYQSEKSCLSADLGRGSCFQPSKYSTACPNPGMWTNTATRMCFGSEDACRTKTGRPCAKSE